MDQLTQDSFPLAPGWLVIDVTSPDCAPCQLFAPIFARVAARHPTLRFATLDAEAEPALAAALGVWSVPTLLVFHDGVQVAEEPDLLPEHVVEELLVSLGACAA